MRDITSENTRVLAVGKSQSNRRADAIIVGLGIAVIVIVAISLMLGRYPIDPLEAVGMLASSVFPVDQTWTEQQATLFFNVRLPRILLALMVGCCLSVAGAAYQGTFQNPLVSPDILGASQGAAFGAAVAILAGFTAGMVSVSAFALLTVLLVLLISARAKGNHMMVVVLAGVMVSSLFQAGVSYAKLIADPTDELADITYWLMGSLTGAKMTQVTMIFPILLVGCIVLFALRWRINILTMGDDEASTMGVNARLIRIIVIIAATFVTAPRYQFRVGRRHHHQRNKSDVIRQARIFFLITFELFFRPTLHSAINLFGCSVHCLIEPLNNKKVLFMTNILRIDRISCTFTKRQKVDRIEQIGFSHPVLPEKAIQFSRKIQFYLLQVLIVQYRYTLQYHVCTLSLVTKVERFSGF